MDWKLAPVFMLPLLVGAGMYWRVALINTKLKGGLCTVALITLCVSLATPLVVFWIKPPPEEIRVALFLVLMLVFGVELFVGVVANLVVHIIFVHVQPKAVRR
jgi:hypothetical protein